MHATLLTAGTTGDFAPFLALAEALRDRGHRVRVATHERYRDRVEPAGCEFAVLPGDPESLLELDVWDGLSVSLARPVAHARAIHESLATLLTQITDADIERACEGTDIVIFSATLGNVHGVAERMGLPSICGALTPLGRTRAFPHPILAGSLRLGATLNALSYAPAQRLLREPFTEPVRPAARRALDRWPPVPILFGFSQAVVPRPDDWPSHMKVTGYWSSRESEAALPEAVASFLEDRVPTLFATFGSMRPAEPEATGRMIVAAARRAGMKAIIGAGWGGLGRGLSGDDILVVGPVPHRALLPRVAAVMHHGGAGTTAAGLLAGCPTFVAPFIYDQFFWGTRVAALGVGPKPVAQHKLSPAALDHALVTLNQPGVRARARLLGERLALEHGAMNAAMAVESIA